MGCGLSAVERGYVLREETTEGIFLSRPKWIGSKPLSKDECKAAFLERRQYLTRGSSCEVMLVYHTGTRLYYLAHFFHKRRVFERKLMPSLQKRLDKSTYLGFLYGFASPILGVTEDTQHIIFLSEVHPGGDLHMLVHRTHTTNARLGVPSGGSSSRGLAEDVVKFYAAEIASALHLLHKERRAVYCDLKPKNVAITWDGHIKLIDSGSIRRSPGLDRGKSTRLLMPIEGKGVECTTDYAPPELLQQKRFHEKADWWSFGATIHYLLTGDAPFRSTKHSSAVGVTARAVRGDRVRLPPTTSPEVRDLLVGLLRPNADRRLGFEAIREHPWFRSLDWRAAAEHRLWPPFIPNIRWKGDIGYFRGRPQRPPLRNIDDYSPMAMYAQGAHLRLRPHDDKETGEGAALNINVARDFLRTGIRTDQVSADPESGKGTPDAKKPGPKKTTSFSEKGLKRANTERPRMDKKSTGVGNRMKSFGGTIREEDETDDAVDGTDVNKRLRRKVTMKSKSLHGRSRAEIKAAARAAALEKRKTEAELKLASRTASRGVLVAGAVASRAILRHRSKQQLVRAGTDKSLLDGIQHTKVDDDDDEEMESK